MEKVFTPALYLVATPIGNMGDVSPRSLEVLAAADLIACEDTRVTKKLLDLLGIDKKMSQLISVYEHNEKNKSPEIIAQIKDARLIVYVSDSGMPAVSDPGAKLVRACHDADIKVTCVPGPSSVVSAVALSGYDETSFSFYGFFPRVKKEQQELIDEIKVSRKISVIFESPKRVTATLAVLSNALGEDRKATLCREITKKFEEIVSADLGSLVRKFKEAPKGECVIVIAPTETRGSSLDDEALTQALQQMKNAGMSSKDVVEVLQSITELPKNKIKDVFSKLK